MQNRDRDEESSIRTVRDNLICSPFFSFVIVVGLSGKKKAFKQNLNRNGRRAKVIKDRVPKKERHCFISEGAILREEAIGIAVEDFI